MAQDPNTIISSWYSGGAVHPVSMARQAGESNPHLLRRFLKLFQDDWGAFPPDSVPPPAPDFSVTVTPTSVAVNAGQTASYVVTVTASNGFAGSVFISASSPGIACAVSPTSILPGQAAVLSVTPPASMAGTKYVSVIGTSGSLSHMQTVSLVVQTPAMGGYTVFPLAADARQVFCSSSAGNDGSDGLSQATPKRTLAAARSLMRNNFPDQLMLKCGDTWDDSFGNGWEPSGRSMSERMLVSSYGSGARPMLRTGTGNGFSLWGTGGGNHLAIAGLHFWAHTRTGSNGAPRGVQAYGSISNLLVEDCYIQAFDTNMVIQGGGRHKNIALRLSVIVDAFTTTGSNTAGMFCSSIDGFLVEGNVIDHNGWRDDVTGSNPSIFLHNVYVQNGATGVVFRDNIISGTDGLQLRPGGTVENNLFAHNAIALLVGGGNTPDEGGVTGLVRKNVFLDGRDLDAGNARGWGLNFENITQAVCEYNIVASNVNGHGPAPLTIGVAGNGAGCRNLTISKNIVYNWNGSVAFRGNASQTQGVQFTDNDVVCKTNSGPLLVLNSADSISGITSARNRFYSSGPASGWIQRAGQALSVAQWKSLVGDTTSTANDPSYPDPGRNITTYMTSLGKTGGLDAFCAEARKMSKANYRPEYTAAGVNAYIRAGFGMVAP